MITIIDYSAGNIRSVQRACDEIGVSSRVTGSAREVLDSDRIIIPGVGAAPSAMESIESLGLDAALRTAFSAGIPILGICIGAQIILDSSEEGSRTCLGLVPGKTVRFKLNDPLLKIPHMGWNEVKVLQPHPLLDGISPGDEFYFVHSYYPRPEQDGYVYAISEYGGVFCVALGKDNLFATQFHPEKSGRLGLGVLERFSRWDGKPSNSAKEEVE